ncbi:hypothetical protein [Mesorhizobium sp. WSM3224]|uniref:hypothetical protein n=1 Tax=Mesorhizobium sp. WSM3224 TaxID=1040986 RepID=UPI0012EB4E80|nr:hypothetical protein [Mesorhizobium sp. WSM3224]
MQPQRLKSPCSQSLLKTTLEVPWQGPRTAVFAAFSSHLRGKLLAQKIIIDKSNAYAHGKDLRLNFRMLEVYHDGARALITKESGRNQELINAW